VSWKYGMRAAAAALCVLAATVVRAADTDGPWEVRVRLLYLDPANGSDAIPNLVPPDAIHVNNKWLPDLDFEYHFTPHWSSELILTYPQVQEVYLTQSALGPAHLGDFRHLPPVLTVKYNFMPESDFRPYIGAGVNYTLIYDVNLAVPTVGPLTLARDSFGPAGQVGFDWKIGEHWFLNADAKWVKIHSDVKLDGMPITNVQINPWLLGVGFGYRFGGPHAPAAAPAPAPMAAPPPPPPPPPVAAPPPPAPPPPAPPPAEQILKGVNFDTDSAHLRPESRTVLDALVSAIRGCGCSKVTIRGYTDSTGSSGHNQQLSERRAAAVRDYLTAHGIAAGMLTAQGLGQSDPIDSNATAAGRAANRRVTVQFLSGAAQ